MPIKKSEQTVDQDLPSFDETIRRAMKAPPPPSGKKAKRKASPKKKR